MQAITSKLYSLSYSQAKTYWLAILFVAGNILLPQLCHFIPQGGFIFLPIYFFTLIASCKYGWKAGLLTAILSPLANNVLFGMPPMAVFPSILTKSILLVAAAGLIISRCHRASIASLAGIVLSYQVVGCFIEWGITGSIVAALQDFRLGIPGMLLQIFGCYWVINYLLRK